MFREKKLKQMNKKQQRLRVIIDIIRTQRVSNQAQLVRFLKRQGIHTTQATLSRDLKELKVTKVVTESGYIYIIPHGNDLQDSLLMSGEKSITQQQHVGFISIEISGNFAVIKTRNGYAAGLAYDIDMSKSDEIIGTIAGADTVFAILREGVSKEQAMKFFSRFMPIGY